MRGAVFIGCHFFLMILACTRIGVAPPKGSHHLNLNPAMTGTWPSHSCSMPNRIPRKTRAGGILYFSGSGPVVLLIFYTQLLDDLTNFVFAQVTPC